ncbi:MAG: hypothetical protein K0R18_2670 [Bacillales bacterium]|jgi:hypothetical protein|nr:hypothetical protein [Bacillales bacterium]
MGIKSNISIVKLVIFSLIILGVSVFIIYEINHKKGESTIDKVKQKPIENLDKSYLISEKVKGFSFVLGSQIREINYNGKTVKIEVIVNEDKNHVAVSNLKINDNETNINFFEVYEFQIIDNLIILTAGYQSALSGTLYAFNMTGEKILEIHELNAEGMTLNSSFEISDNKILFAGTRIDYGDALRISNNQQISLLDKNDIKNLKDEDVFSAEYEINYLGNGKFGDMVKTKTIETYKLWKESIEK